MNDDKKNGLVQTSQSPTTTTNTNTNKLMNKLAGANIKKPLWQRAKEIEAAQAAQQAVAVGEAATIENRLALILDCSGSMNESVGEYLGPNRKTKMDYLRDAVQTFATQLDWSTTSVAIECFPSRNNEWEPGMDVRPGYQIGRFPLTADQNLINTIALGLTASGGTPMAPAIKHVIDNYPVTRGIIISDGEADSNYDAVESAKFFREAEVSIDCVHIGNSTDGEQLLKDIADMTGGIYLKFTDVSAFSKSFSYLTPRYRAVLANGTVDATAIGAKEIRLLGK
jgi:hypothetical protein